MMQSTFDSYDSKAQISVGTRGMFVTLDATDGGSRYEIDIRKTEAYALANYIEWLTEYSTDEDEECWTLADMGSLIPAVASDRDEPNSFEDFPEIIRVSSDVDPDTNGDSTAVVILDIHPLEELPCISITLHANTGAEREFVAALLRAAASAA